MIRTGGFESAKACFQELERNGIEPNYYNCSAFIVNACDSGHLDDAMVGFEKLLALKANISISIFTLLMDALHRDHRANDALRVYKGVRDFLKPDVRFLTPLISVLEGEGRFRDAGRILSDAVRDGVFKPSFGYDQKGKILNFHRDAIEFDPKIVDGHVEGVDSALAATIFRRLVPTFVPGTKLVTGYHSGCRVKDTIAALMRENNMKPVPAIWPDGRVNEGAFVWGTKIDANLPAGPNAPSRPPSNAIKQTEPDNKPAFSWANRAKSQSVEASVQATSVSNHEIVANRNLNPHTFPSGADRISAVSYSVASDSSAADSIASNQDHLSDSIVEVPRKMLFESGWISKSLNPNVPEYDPTSRTSWQVAGGRAATAE